jgi:hypothetical protein
MHTFMHTFSEKKAISEEELEAFADRAHDAYSNKSGFIRAYVDTYEPPVIALEMADNQSAEGMRLDLEVQGYPFRLEIPRDRDDTVLMHRA